MIIIDQRMKNVFVFYSGSIKNGNYISQIFKSQIGAGICVR